VSRGVVAMARSLGPTGALTPDGRGITVLPPERAGEAPHTRRHVMRNRPALAISLLALFVALGGTGYAAFSLPRNSVGAKQLKRNAVTTPKIKNGAVSTGKLKNGAVTGAKMNFRGVIVPQ